MPRAEATGGEGRPWGGRSLTDRRATRRMQLLEAGLELMSSGGSGKVAVRAVCREARLTERYFYENFGGREALLLAVYGWVADQARQVLSDAVASAPAEPEARARAAVDAFVGLILDDPRKGRVLLLEPLAEPVLSRRGAQSLPSFAALVREQLGAASDEAGREMTSIALVGALTSLFSSYLDGALRVSRERLVGHCVTLLLGAHALHSGAVTKDS